jgi:hypothetical protein
VKEFGYDITEYSEEGRKRKYKLQGQAHDRLWTFRLGLLGAIYVMWIAIDIVVFAYVASKAT